MPNTLGVCVAYKKDIKWFLWNFFSLKSFSSCKKNCRQILQMAPFKWIQVYIKEKRIYILSVVIVFIVLADEFLRSFLSFNLMNT